MSNDLPDYSAIEVPDDEPETAYSTHERRAAVWRTIKEAKSPTRVNKAALARRFDVARSTIYRDFERLQEWASESLGDEAALTTRSVFEGVVADLLDEDDWRATKAAWDVVLEWNEWLADIGKQHREPDRAELDVRRRGVAYHVVREGDGVALEATDSDGIDDVDPEAVGFTKAPAEIDVETPGGDGDE